jgi:hypothetical protein
MCGTRLKPKRASTLRFQTIHHAARYSTDLRYLNWTTSAQPLSPHNRMHRRQPSSIAGSTMMLSCLETFPWPATPAEPPSSGLVLAKAGQQCHTVLHRPCLSVAKVKVDICGRILHNECLVEVSTASFLTNRSAFVLDDVELSSCDPYSIFDAAQHWNMLCTDSHVASSAERSPYHLESSHDFSSCDFTTQHSSRSARTVADRVATTGIRYVIDCFYLLVWVRMHQNMQSWVFQLT